MALQICPIRTRSSLLITVPLENNAVNSLSSSKILYFYRLYIRKSTSVTHLFNYDFPQICTSFEVTEVNVIRVAPYCFLNGCRKLGFIFVRLLESLKRSLIRVGHHPALSGSNWCHRGFAKWFSVWAWSSLRRSLGKYIFQCEQDRHTVICLLLWDATHYSNLLNHTLVTHFSI